MAPYALRASSKPAVPLLWHTEPPKNFSQVVTVMRCNKSKRRRGRHSSLPYNRELYSSHDVCPIRKIQGAAEWTPIFQRVIKNERNKLQKKSFIFSKSTFDLRTFLSKFPANDEQCGLWPRPAETKSPLNHQIPPIWAGGSSLTFHNTD